MKLLPHRLIFIGLIALALAAIIATTAASLPGKAGNTAGSATSSGQTNETAPEGSAPNWELAEAAAAQPAAAQGDLQASLPPPAERNPCLHCHIAGEIYNEWSPITRWFVFGAMGVTFVFGITRNAIVWRTRERWHDRWMAQLGSAAALFFILQSSTGIILLLLTNATADIIVQIVMILQAVHWGSSIGLFIAALGFSAGGALLPWYQRPFWGMIFITTLIGGALAVANLSFTYLYAEWHDPLPPSHSFILHMLLSPVAIAGIISIYYMWLRKRGETQ
jgi:hypothetical protein